MELPTDEPDPRRIAALCAEAGARKAELSARIARLQRPPRTTSTARLRVLVYPALLFVVLLRLGGAPSLAGDSGFEPLTGSSFAGARTFDSPLDVSTPVQVRPGYVLGTGPEASARLGLGRAEVLLGSGTRALVERLSPRRVRLFSGSLTAQGKLAISSAGGVVQLDEDAEARIEYARGRLEVHATRGVVELTGPRLHRRLAAGTTAVLP